MLPRASAQPLAGWAMKMGGVDGEGGSLEPHPGQVRCCKG